ncbi:MAG: peptide chain release factor 2, partial [Actinomycetota bacterium]
MRDFSSDLKELRRRLDEARSYLNIDTGRTRLGEVEAIISEPNLWDDQDRAKKVNAEYANLKGDLGEFDTLAGSIDDVEVLADLAREEGDESQEPEIAAEIARIAKQFDGLELRSLFTGSHDGGDCIVQINAKDGGVDAQ